MAYELHMSNNPFTVDVQTQYLPEQSTPEQGVYRFAYTITITNVGEGLAQLVGRHWLITDGQRRIQEVRGLGVAGRQPALQPGASHTYTSGCELSTPSGSMQGHFVGITEECELFTCPIPLFDLNAQAQPGHTLGSSSHHGLRTLH